MTRKASKQTVKQLRIDYGLMLYQARVAAGLSQVALARRIKYPQSGLSAIEAGRRGASESLQIRIAEALGGYVIPAKFSILDSVMSYRKYEKSE